MGTDEHSSSAGRVPTNLQGVAAIYEGASRSPGSPGISFVGALIVVLPGICPRHRNNEKGGHIAVCVIGGA